VNTSVGAQISDDKSIRLLGETGEKLKKQSKPNQTPDPDLAFLQSYLRTGKSKTMRKLLQISPEVLRETRFS